MAAPIRKLLRGMKTGPVHDSLERVVEWLQDLEDRVGEIESTIEKI